jgi:hypothetical protein
MYKGDDLLVLIDQWDWFILSGTQLGVGKENVQIQFTKVSWLPQWRMKDQIKSHHLPSGIADKYFHNKDLRVVFEY